MVVFQSVSVLRLHFRQRVVTVVGADRCWFCENMGVSADLWQHLVVQMVQLLPQVMILADTTFSAPMLNPLCTSPYLRCSIVSVVN